MTRHHADRATGAELSIRMRAVGEKFRTRRKGRVESCRSAPFYWGAERAYIPASFPRGMNVSILRFHRGFHRSRRHWLCASASPSLAQDRRVPSSPAELRLSYAPIVQRVQPAVVNVYAAKTVQNRNPLLDDPIFRRFFGVPGNKQPEQMQRSLGSGVMVDASGLVVTNNPRHRGRRPGQGIACRQARVRGRDRAEGQPHRSRGAAPQGHQGEVSRPSTSPIRTNCWSATSCSRSAIPSASARP